MKRLFVCSLMSLVLGLFAISDAMAQEKTLSGVVKDSGGEPLPGVTVLVKGTSIGTYTLQNGTFKLIVPETARTLEIRSIGRKTIVMPIGDDTEFNITMEQDDLLLDQVVVTAVGIEREKKALGYAVQDVEGQALSNSQEVNVVSALSSKVAGVQVNQAAGTAGGSSFIKIRGTSSITGDNQPLFVVDGVPIDNTSTYTGNPDDGRNNWLFGVAQSNRAIDIASEDIADVTVLKGPAATALYGLRASSGAVIITTKKGTSQTGTISAQVQLGVTLSEVNKLPEMQNKYAQGSFYAFGPDGAILGPESGWMQSWGGAIDTMRYDGDASYLWDKNGRIVGQSDPSATSKAVVPYDNLNEFFQTGVTWNNSVALSGGVNRTNYYFSISDLRDQGVVPLNEWSRTSVRLTGQTTLGDMLTIGGGVNYINSGGTRIEQGSNTSGVMLGLLRTPITFDNANGFEDPVDTPEAYMNADGSQRTYRGGGGYDNPYWTINRNPFEDDVHRIIGNVYFTVTPEDWLEFTWRLGNDFYSDRRKQHFAVGSNTASTGRIYDHQIFNSDFNSDLMVSINRELSDDMDLRFLAGHNMYSTNFQEVFNQGDGLTIRNFYHLSNAQGIVTREKTNEKRTMALYFDAGLSYQDLLFLNVTGRNEWSTSLPEDNNSFFYPAVNVGWVFTESFKALEDVIPYGKLRVSWAEVGKDAPLYGTLTYFTQTNYSDGWVNVGESAPHNGQPGFMLDDVLGNEDLKPETTTAIEFGADLRFFDNRLGIDFTYYDMTHKDQIFSVPYAASSGFLALVMNAGELTNTGIELVVNATILELDDLTWNLGVNFAQNENEVTELAEGVENITIGGFTGATIRAVAGQPYGSIYGFGWARDDNGNILIEDDPEAAFYGYPIMDPEEQPFGSADPDWTMGINTDVTWNNISLSAVVDIREGGNLWNGTLGALYFMGTAKETEVRGQTTVFEGVLNSTGENNTIEVPLDEEWLAWGNANGFIGDNTEDFIESTSWVRLREVTLTYTFPDEIVSSLPFQSLVVSATGRNLWLSTDYRGVDPETSLTGTHNSQGLDYFNMPNTRSYSLNVRFGM